MIDKTSIWAYNEIKASGYLGERQSIVLSVFVENYPNAMTATALVNFLGRGVSENVRNRITELEQMGFLEKFSEIRCEVTDRMVNVYRWTGRREPLPHRIERLTCEHCEGIGKVNKKVYYNESNAYVPTDLFEKENP